MGVFQLGNQTRGKMSLPLTRTTTNPEQATVFWVIVDPVLKGLNFSEPFAGLRIHFFFSGTRANFRGNSSLNPFVDGFVR